MTKSEIVYYKIYESGAFPRYPWFPKDAGENRFNTVEEARAAIAPGWQDMEIHRITETVEVVEVVDA